MSAAEENVMEYDTWWKKKGCILGVHRGWEEIGGGEESLEMGRYPLFMDYEAGEGPSNRAVIGAGEANAQGSVVLKGPEGRCSRRAWVLRTWFLLPFWASSLGCGREACFCSS